MNKYILLYCLFLILLGSNCCADPLIESKGRCQNNFCGNNHKYSPQNGVCMCEPGCEELGNCCDDYYDVCGYCTQYCGGFNPYAQCYCDEWCALMNDCCPDWFLVCNQGTCQNRCNSATPGMCRCDDECDKYGTCCPDKGVYCLSVGPVGQTTTSPNPDGIAPSPPTPIPPPPPTPTKPTLSDETIQAIQTQRRQAMEAAQSGVVQQGTTASTGTVAFEGQGKPVATPSTEPVQPVPTPGSVSLP